jgi:hypothetical protein
LTYAVDNWHDAVDMAGDEKARLKLRLPSGLELEAEGAQDFVSAQIQELLRLTEPAEKASEPRAEPEPLARILDQDGSDLELRALPAGRGDPQDACLALILGAETRLGQPKPTAAQLAKWLRKSGFKIKRMDRILSEALRAGRILASGTRRSRRYELSTKGRIQALLACERLARAL